MQIPRESSHQTRPVKTPALVPLTRGRIDHFTPTCAPGNAVAVQIDPVETKAFVAKLMADATSPRLPPQHPPPHRPADDRTAPPRPQRKTRRPPV